jgi:hypothetical protein
VLPEINSQSDSRNHQAQQKSQSKNDWLPLFNSVEISCIKQTLWPVLQPSFQPHFGNPQHPKRARKLEVGELPAT